MSPAQEAAIRAAAIAHYYARESITVLHMALEKQGATYAADYAVAQAKEQKTATTLSRAQYQWQEPGPPLSSCLNELAALITTQAPHDALSVALERARRALEGGV